MQGSRRSNLSGRILDSVGSLFMQSWFSSLVTFIKAPHFESLSLLGRLQIHQFRITDQIHHQKGQQSDREPDDSHEDEHHCEGCLNQVTLTLKLYSVPIRLQDVPSTTRGLFSYCEQIMPSNPQRNIERYSNGQKTLGTVSRGTKKPPTSRKGMISTGTSAITTEASENSVERSKPNDELIKAHSSSESSDLKKTPALLSRLQGKQAMAKKRKQVRISIGKTATVRPTQQAEVEQVLLSLSRMKTGLSKLKRLTLAKTQLKPVFMTKKKMQPLAFWTIQLQLVPSWQYRMMQRTPKKMDCTTFRITSRGCLNWFSQFLQKTAVNCVHQLASIFSLASIGLSKKGLFKFWYYPLCFWKPDTKLSTTCSNSALMLSSVKSIIFSILVSISPSLFISFMQWSVGFVCLGTGYPILLKQPIESLAYPSQII